VITIGLIGCGTWGAAILRTLVDLQAQVVVAEPDPARRREAIDTGAVGVVETVSDLTDVDGLIIATPASTHLAVMRLLADFSVPIFIEKPLATSVADAEAIAACGGARAFVMHVWHYHSGVRALADLAASGRLGRALVLRTERKNWTSPRTDVDSVWTLLPHDLSITASVLGHIPPPIFAHAERLNGKAVGMVAGLSDGQTLVVMDVSNRFSDKRREIRLHGDRGVAVLPTDDAPSLEIIWNEQRPGGLPEIDHISIERKPALETELKVFLNHLSGGPPPPTGMAEGVEVIRRLVDLRTLAGLTS